MEEEGGDCGFGVLDDIGGEEVVLSQRRSAWRRVSSYLDFFG